MEDVAQRVSSPLLVGRDAEAAGLTAAVERVLDGARVELAGLVPELDAPPPAMPGRLFELLLGVLHRLAEGRGLVLVVEDLHWADRSTRDPLAFLHHNLRGPVALVLTYRSDELHRRHPLRPFLAELERGGRAERLELGPLDRRALVGLLAGILGQPAPASPAEELFISAKTQASMSPTSWPSSAWPTVPTPPSPPIAPASAPDGSPTVTVP
jgi:hypothetical protein